MSDNNQSEHQLKRAQIDELADAIAICAARIDSAAHQLLTHIREFDKANGWAAQGARSCAQWLSWRIGYTLGTAGEKVRVANALAELPKIDAAFRKGRLSYCKVRAMTRVATAKNEALLLQQAQSSTGAQLERICRGLKRATRQGERPHAPERYARKRHTTDGMVRIELQLHPDEAELVWQAMQEARRQLTALPHQQQNPISTQAEQNPHEEPCANKGRYANKEPHALPSDDPCQRDTLSAESRLGNRRERFGSATGVPATAEPITTTDTRSNSGTPTMADARSDLGAQTLPDTRNNSGAQTLPGTRNNSGTPTMADAAVMMAQAHLCMQDKSRGGTAYRGADRRMLFIHLREDQLQSGFRAELQDGTALDSETFLRIACDSGLVSVKTDGNGDPLDLGRKQRTPSAALMRALRLRHRHCAFPGCRCDAHMEAHHLRHWAQGGATSLENTTLLCSAHHTAVHEGGFRVERTAGGELCFFEPGGKRIEQAPAAAPVEPDVLASLVTEQAHVGIEIDRRTSLPHYDGGRLNLHGAVGALIHRMSIN